MKKILSIDLGGTKLLGCVITEKGDLLHEIRRDTLAYEGKDSLLENLYSLIESILESTDVDAIGIASAGRINTNEGSVYYSTDNLPNWTGTELRRILSEKYSKPVYVENDVNAAGYGEYWLGSSRGMQSSICITLGTGVAGAMMIKDMLWQGHHYSAGELGHMKLHPEGRDCNCGMTGCFEQYCSGTALVKMYNERNLIGIKTGYDFFKKIDINDVSAITILDEFSTNLVYAIEVLANTFDPEVFVIGGGLINTADYWWDDFQTKLSHSALKNVFVPAVEKATLENKAGVFGITKLTLQYLDSL